MDERVFICLGANLGDRARTIRRVVARLQGSPETRVVARASLYETDPVGAEDQPPFLNTVVELRTRLSPRDLLAWLKGIERRLGRKPRARWGPREIDLDLLLYGEHVLDEPGLVVPHPELHRRRFVLVPLVELAPDLVHPVSGRTMAALLKELDREGDRKGVRPSQGTSRQRKRS